MLTNATKMQLAKLLPDSIRHMNYGGYGTVVWKDSGYDVKEIEWPYILREIARRNNLTRVLMLTLEASDEDIAKAILDEMREKKV